MAAIDDLTAAIQAEDDAIAKAIAFIQGVPAVVQQAVDAAKASNDAALNQLKSDVQVHADQIVAALPQPPAPPTTTG